MDFLWSLSDSDTENVCRRVVDLFKLLLFRFVQVSTLTLHQKGTDTCLLTEPVEKKVKIGWRVDDDKPKQRLRRWDFFRLAQRAVLPSGSGPPFPDRGEAQFFNSDVDL